MSDKDIKKLLRHVYTNSGTLDEWLQNPQEKSKEWNCPLDPTQVEAVKATVQFVTQELQQIQEVRYVTQHTIKKINQASRHTIISFYSTLVLHIVAFVIGIVVLSLGIYAFFTERIFLGMILGGLGLAEIVYFLLVKPFEELNSHIENMVQMEVALGSWFNEMTYWQVFVRDTQLEEKQIVAQAMRDAAKWAIMLIQDYTKSKKINLDNERYENVLAKTRAAFDKFRNRSDMAPSPEKLLTSSHQEPKPAPKQEPQAGTSPSQGSVENTSRPEQKNA